MRKIKFRAWDTEKKVMTIVLEMSLEEDNITLMDGDCRIWDTVKGYVAIPMQYTGLKDKSGKEIYEGDIVVEDEEMYSVCKWINPLGCFAFVPIEMNGESEDNLRSCTEFNNIYELFTEYGIDTFFDNQTPNKYVEVVGNIYENPELLN